MQSINRFIACEPFQSLAVEKEFKGNFATVKNKNSLLSTKVVYVGYGFLGEDTIIYRPGWTLYLDAEATKGAAWTRKVYKIGPEPEPGKQDERVPFILIPDAAVLLIQPEDQKLLGDGEESEEENKTEPEEKPDEKKDPEDNGSGGVPRA